MNTVDDASPNQLHTQFGWRCVGARARLRNRVDDVAPARVHSQVYNENPCAFAPINTAAASLVCERTYFRRYLRVDTHTRSHITHCSSSSSCVYSVSMLELVLPTPDSTLYLAFVRTRVAHICARCDYYRTHTHTHTHTVLCGVFARACVGGCCVL